MNLEESYLTMIIKDTILYFFLKRLHHRDEIYFPLRVILSDIGCPCGKWLLKAQQHVVKETII